MPTTNILNEIKERVSKLANETTLSGLRALVYGRFLIFYQATEASLDVYRILFDAVDIDNTPQHK